MKEVADYYARLVSGYTQGGFTGRQNSLPNPSSSRSYSNPNRPTREGVIHLYLCPLEAIYTWPPTEKQSVDGKPFVIDIRKLIYPKLFYHSQYNY